MLVNQGAIAIKLWSGRSPRADINATRPHGTLLDRNPHGGRLDGPGHPVNPCALMPADYAHECAQLLCVRARQ
ncbi:MAG: hypothetical protein ACHRXM_34415 [Isosphaerales bacterium]